MLFWFLFCRLPTSGGNKQGKKVVVKNWKVWYNVVMRNCDICFIGGGPAGLSGAIYAARAGFDVVILEKLAVGGQVNITPHIENYAGFGSVSGVELSAKMGEQAEACGAQIMYDQAISITTAQNRQTVELLGGEIINSRALVLAMGAQAKTLGLVGEAELVGAGVSYCATCDGAFFKGKNVVVVGGGKAASLDVEYLAPIVKTVTWINGGEIIDSTPSSVVKMPNCTVVKLGGSPLKSITVNTPTGMAEIPCDGMFVAVGFSPANALAKGLVQLDAKGYIVTNENMQTSEPNIYAIGDIRSKDFRQIVTAVSDGAIAAFNISKSIKKIKT